MANSSIVQNVVGCLILRGYPTFTQVTKSATPGLIALYVLAGVAVALALASFCSELRYMKLYVGQILVSYSIFHSIALITNNLV